jgi:hypothetical protein
MQHAAVAGAHEVQPFSTKYCDIEAKRASVRSSRRFAPAQPGTNATAAGNDGRALQSSLWGGGFGCGWAMQHMLHKCIFMQHLKRASCAWPKMAAVKGILAL